MLQDHHLATACLSGFWKHGSGCMPPWAVLLATNLSRLNTLVSCHSSFCWVLDLQVNYLGPYHLTRLLEPQLAASAPSRVVNVSSVMHRSGSVDSDPIRFLRDWRKGSQYANTKLANVLFAYESQRRLGPLGVQVGCCVTVHNERYSRHELGVVAQWAIGALQSYVCSQ